MACISAREFAGGVTYVGVGAYAINRNDLISGNPVPQSDFFPGHQRISRWCLQYR